MSIYFTPTYLYIKQHSVTGLLYFGKTKQNPEKYSGSGTYWKLHLNKHGKNIQTIWYCLFLDECTIKEFATAFSDQHHIIESAQWANLKQENGIDGGGILGRKHTEETKRKMSEKKKGQSNGHLGLKQSEETKRKIGQANKGNILPPITNETREKLSNSLKGKIKSPEHRANLSKSLKGKPKSAEHRAKMIATLTKYRSG